MKKSIILLAAMASLMAGCISDDYLGEKEEQISDVISLSGDKEAVSRAGMTGAEAAAVLNNNFIVYAQKSNTAGTDHQEVFDYYNVNYTSGTEYTTTSNTSGWEYVGSSNTNTPAAKPGTQTIKYWDWGYDKYDFMALSRGTNTKTYANLLNGSITYTNIGNDVASGNAVYSLNGSASEISKCFISDLTTVANADFGHTVPLNFRGVAAKVRIALYETIPGYSVKNVKFYVDGSSTETDNTVPTLFASKALQPKGESSVMKVYYPAGIAPKAATKVTLNDASDDNSVKFSGLQYSGPEGREATGNNYLGRTLPTASYATATNAAGAYVTVLPQSQNTPLTLKVDYTLVPIDDATEHIDVKGVTATVPEAYSYWLPNFAYTYIFKITDDKLKPITFDAVKVNDGYQETVTELTMPAITTYQKGNAYTTSTPPAYGVYDPAYPIYITVITTNGGLTTLTTDNSWLYKAQTEDGYLISEATVGEAAVASDHTYTKDGKTLTLTPITPSTAPETFTLEGTKIPAADSPTGTEMTVANASFAPQTANTYVYQFKMADAQYGAATASTLAKGDYTFYEVVFHPDDGANKDRWIITKHTGANGDETIDGTLYKGVPELSGDVTPNTLTKDVTYYTRTGEAGSYIYTSFTAEGDEEYNGDVTYYIDDHGTPVGPDDCTTLTKGVTYYYWENESHTQINRITAEGKEIASGYYTTMAFGGKWELSEANTLTAGKTYYTRTGDAEPYTYSPYTAFGDELIANYYSMIMPIQYIYKVIKVQ